MTIRLGAFVTILTALVGTPCVEAAQVYFIHTDLDGSVAMETDLNRNVVYERTYEPYGLPTTPIEDSPGYTGHVHDSETGLVYAQQRYYDPEVGRFLSIDPVGVNAADGANFNRYWYGNNGPYRYADPNGELAFLIPVAIIAYRAYSAYDTVTSSAANIETLADSNASTSDRAIAGAELIGSLVGGKVGRQAAGKGARMAVKDKPASSPVGRRGQPIDTSRSGNSPSEIDGVRYSGHAVDQMQGRGVPPSAAKDAIDHGAARTGRGGTTIHTSSTNGVEVVTDNQTGSVVTVKTVDRD